MTLGGVPILDWVLLLVVLGFGVEAYVNRYRPDDDGKSDRKDDGPDP